MKLLKLENLIFLLITSIIALLLYVEYSLQKNEYAKEKVSDLKTQYDSKVFYNQKIIDALFVNILEDENLGKLLYEANNPENRDKVRKHVFELYKHKYADLKNVGVLQFHFHLANGDSFLRFHKPSKYGDSLLFRYSIRNILQTKKEQIGFEIGKYFDGYRYVYPVYHNNAYVGSVEGSIDTDSIIKQLSEALHGSFELLINIKNADNVIAPSSLEKNYHKFCVNDGYYIKNHKDSKTHELTDDFLSLEKQIKKGLANGKPFVEFGISKQNNQAKIFTFIPIYDIKQQNVGYIVSIIDDDTIVQIAFRQFIKFLFALVLLSLILYFYKQNKAKTKTIEQLNLAIDKTTLVSKTDLSGKITYVNDAFVSLSGYTEEELLGKPHNIVREPSVAKSVFKDLWETIKSKKSWHGIIKNRAKDGSNYIVDATIIPLLDSNENVLEYIAIRHDITELEQYKEILKEQLNDKSKSLEENIHYTQQYEEAINNATAVLKTDTENKITYINDKFSELSGYTLEDLQGVNCSEIREKKHILNGDCVRLQEDLIKRNVTFCLFYNIDKSGNTFVTNTIVYPISNVQGEIVEHLHLMSDITEIISLHKELEDTQKEIIFKMGEIGESRSKETGYHVRRVAEYSKLLASLLGMSEEEADILKMASPMHDIGKVGIPDSILKKPGKLDQDEFEFMKTHTTTGYEMLKSSERPILKAASIVAGEHHEKWDGSGYPKGLQGEEIHIYGRITALADVFDALGSERVYKKAWEDEKIFNLFKEERGKHFDPQLVDLFFQNLEKFLEIRDMFQDAK